MVAPDDMKEPEPQPTTWMERSLMLAATFVGSFLILVNLGNSLGDTDLPLRDLHCALVLILSLAVGAGGEWMCRKSGWETMGSVVMAWSTTGVVVTIILWAGGHRGVL
jgi:hypothetical protein